MIDPSLPEIAFEETAPNRIVRRFLNDRERFLAELLEEEQQELFSDNDEL